MRKLLILFVCVAGSVIAASTAVRTQGRGGQSARFAAIVVYKSNVSFDGQRGASKKDERDAADPEAWDYVERGVHGKTQTLERQHGFKADKMFSETVRGFSAELTAVQLVALENDPSVELVEADGPVSIVAQTLPWGIERVGANVSSTLAGNGSGAVSGVNVYVIDTGIDAGHKDLNVVKQVNFAGGKNTDCNGHGTHVAGTIAARDNTSDVVGVAPGAPLTAVKVLGCNGSGTFSGVIKGVDWVTANHVGASVANMSLGGGVSAALDAAVLKSAQSGVVYAIAAGNSGANACTSSPARAGAGTDNGIITTAAIDSTNKEASWSNYGPCVDIWGPGVNVLSTKLNGGTTTYSGTSMASPHVAGSAVLYLSIAGGTPASVENQLKSTASAPGTISKNGTSPIRVVNVAGY